MDVTRVLPAVMTASLLWVFTMASTPASSQSLTLCKNYILKVTAQLNGCDQSNQVCLRAPFNHALNHQNYGTHYQSCQATFEAEINTRWALGQSNPAMVGDGTGLEEIIIPELASIPNLSATGAGSNATIPNVEGDSCNKAYYFFSYATQSCKSAACVDQQFKNTTAIPAFKLCNNALTLVRDARKVTLPVSQTSLSKLAH